MIASGPTGTWPARPTAAASRSPTRTPGRRRGSSGVSSATGPYTTSRTATAAVGVPSGGYGLRPYFVCISDAQALQATSGSGYLRIAFPNPSCGNQPGNWYTSDCPEDGSRERHARPRGEHQDRLRVHDLHRRHVLCRRQRRAGQGSAPGGVRREPRAERVSRLPDGEHRQPAVEPDLHRVDGLAGQGHRAPGVPAGHGRRVRATTPSTRSRRSSG